MPVTLKDVAKRAGVSIKTVSNVVNERPYVTDATRTRVLSAIEALEYRPNLSARHLRKGRVGVIALAIPDLSNNYFSDIGDIIIEAAEEQSYTVLIDHTGGTHEQEMLVVSGLRPHLIDGVLLSPLALSREDLDLEQNELPIVLLGEHLSTIPYDHVGIDNVAAAIMATEHLLAQGRQRIAVIGAQQAEARYTTSHLRMQGFHQAMASAGREVDPDLIGHVAVFHRSDGALAMRQLLALPEPPDAVFCFNDLMALGALRTLYEAGCRVPEDVAIVGFDDIEESTYAVPSLTTIAPDKETIGRTAVNLLLDRVRGDYDGPPRHILAPFTLEVRESSRPLK